MELTVTVTTAVFVQALKSVPDTVYVFVRVGVNTVLLLTPFVHVYVAAPEPNKLIVVPAQTFTADALAPTIGKALTRMAFVAVVVQAPFAPITL